MYEHVYPEQISEYIGMYEHVYPEQISEYIGKDAASKLLSQQGVHGRDGGQGTLSRELKGLDLDVGGDGMKAFTITSCQRRWQAREAVWGSARHDGHRPGLRAVQLYHHP